jgi:hypothetical protein
MRFALRGVGRTGTTYTQYSHNTVRRLIRFSSATLADDYTPTRKQAEPSSRPEARGYATPL